MEGDVFVMEKVQECANMLQSATCDNDRLAALMLIPKLLADNGDIVSLEYLVSALSTDFISRLLSCETSPDTELLYTSVAINVLSVFLKSSSQKCRNHFKTCLSPLIDATCRQLVYSDESSDNQLLIDSLNCIQTLVCSQTKCSASVEEKFTHLLDLLTTNKHYRSNGFALLSSFVPHSENSVLIVDSFISKIQISNSFKDIKSEYAIELLSDSEALWTVMCGSNIHFDHLPVWAENMRIGLRTLLQSRLDPVAQGTCLRISALLLELFDWRWVAGDPEFVVILANLASVELRLLLDTEPTQLLSNECQKSLHVRCCYLIEKSMLLVEGESDFEIPDQFAIKISKCSQEIVTFLLGYINKCRSDHIKISPFALFPILRVICVFLSTGGDVILDKRILKDAIPSLLNPDSLSFECEKEFQILPEHHQMLVSLSEELLEK